MASVADYMSRVPTHIEVISEILYRAGISLMLSRPSSIAALLAEVKYAHAAVAEAGRRREKLMPPPAQDIIVSIYAICRIMGTAHHRARAMPFSRGDARHDISRRQEPPSSRAALDDAFAR